MNATALIADDEPLLREHLRAHLSRLWPELRIVGQARNGREAIELFEREQPAMAFLDVHMPGLSGIDAARAISHRAHIVFVTAYEQYAVQAFESGAIDYLVKPFDADRLDETVRRLKLRMSSPQGASEAERVDALLDRLSAQLSQSTGRRTWLQWIKASVGQTVKLISVDDVCFFKSDEKYTLVAWSGGEALIRKPIRELMDEVDPERFAQVHRSVVVNLHHVAQVVRGPNETADIHLKGRTEVLPVSRNYLHLFRQM